MTSFSRAQRVSGHIQKTLTDILRKDIKDPRIGMVTITRVKLTTDLRIARVYFALSGSQKSIEEAKAGFNSARGYLKRTLASQLGLRYMPNIEFYYDDSFEYASHIEALLRSIKEDDETDNTPY
jgi:ribosome-binding factor A